MYVYMNAHIIYILYLEHRTVAIYSEFGLKDRYFKRGPPLKADLCFETAAISSKSYHS